MNNSNLAHAFAHQTKNSGNGSSMFFEGNRIYSYGHHFEIARLVGGYALYNCDTYSNSTAKHQAHVRSALYQTIITVSKFFDLSDNATTKNRAHKANLTHYLEGVNALIDSLSRARKKEFYVNEINRIIDQISGYIAAFDVPKSAISVKVARIIEQGHYVLTSDELIKLDEQKRKAIEKKRTDSAKAVKKFLNYESNRAYGSPDVHLRKSEDGSKVETSAGANVPFEDAKRLLVFVRRSKATSARYSSEQINGSADVGIYRVDYIDSGTLKVGCHVIKYKQIEEFAKRNNL